MPSGGIAPARAGETLYRALIAAGVPFDAPCGGRGTCGRCRVRAAGALEPPGERERETLGARLLGEGWRLACLAIVAGDAQVRLAGPLSETVAGAPSASAVGPLGLAVDLGTTSIAVRLVRLADGRAVAQASLLNPQHAHGADVLTRVSFAAEGGTAQLRDLAREGVSSAAAAVLAASGAAGSRVRHMTVTGNTVMLHLFAGEDPTGLGTSPYTPRFLAERVLEPGSVRSVPKAEVVLLPGAGAFLGADAVAAAVATGVADAGSGPALLMDLGTNGELVLAAGGRLFGASAAAGPAFEAVGVSSGMRAVSGAIDRVEAREGDFSWSVMGGGDAAGLCGSGLLDALAAARELGVLDASGRLAAGVLGPAGERVAEAPAGLELVLVAGGTGEANGPAVTVTQLDVRALQLAKGAVATAVRFLLRRAQLSSTDPVRLVVAGAFGSGLRPRTAVTLGILPPQWAGSVEQAGNAALEGASRALVEEGFRDRLAAVASSMELVDLAEDPRFEDAFLASLDLSEWASDEP